MEPKKFMDILLDKGVDPSVVAKLSVLSDGDLDAIVTAVRQASYLTSQFVLENVKEELAMGHADPQGLALDVDPILVVSVYQELLRASRKVSAPG